MVRAIFCGREHIGKLISNGEQLLQELQLGLVRQLIVLLEVLQLHEDAVDRLGVHIDLFFRVKHVELDALQDHLQALGEKQEAQVIL